ncbi:hypothetical protein FH972_021483 [Carpinus fangiana]|uniref:Centrosomin N-terminal motif 1 domain-containing protein n=1 Tax=Carpinus fangiana TaxID=176857 RepID=A0A5N6KQ16_9ROSI|nr:hypothetical protein FH972_021483 [Carpinus fangiana]
MSSFSPVWNFRATRFFATRSVQLSVASAPRMLRILPNLFALPMSPWPRLFSAVCVRCSPNAPRPTLKQPPAAFLRPAVLPLSEYLQSRLRERKAESARIPRHATPLSATPARDDNIFDRDDEHDLLNRRRNNHLYQSSPMRVPSRAGSRSTGTKSTTSSQPRAVGARELDAHVDKLSKENFDLKLELYHRREKIDELERKLRNVQQLEHDAAELIHVNQDLCQELEKRDRAIDEAVVMICDLEDRLQTLEEQLSETRPSSLTMGTSASTAASQCLQSPPHKELVGMISSEMSQHLETVGVKVLPEVSSRMSDTNLPDSLGNARHIPSFIDSTEPATTALRSMFVHDGRQIRAIPSAASLVSATETREEDLLNESPRSPVLSELSESDFRSIYGRTTPKQSAQPTLDERPTSPEDSPVVVIPRERKLARTNQWVKDRAISPDVPSHCSSYSTVPAFQSLGDALRRDCEQPLEPTASVLTRKQPRQFRPVDLQKPDKESEPAFSQNVFPPTPDTMATRQPSHQSSFSIIRDKSSMEGADVADTHNQFNQYLKNQARDDHLGRDLAPRLFAYEGQQFYEEKAEDPDAQDFGASLFRHEGFAQEIVSMNSRHAYSQKTRPVVLARPKSPVVNSVQHPSTPHRMSRAARPISIHMASNPGEIARVTNTLTPTLPSELASERPLHRSISLSPTPSSQRSFASPPAVTHMRRTGDLALTPSVISSHTSQNPPAFPASQQEILASTPRRRAALYPADSVHLGSGSSAPYSTLHSSVKSREHSPATYICDTGPPKPVSTIRQRMARLTHRTNSISSSSTRPLGAFSTEGKALPPLPSPSIGVPIVPSPSDSASVASPSLTGTPTPMGSSQRHSRSASATRRFFTQHRRRSSATPVSPTLTALRPTSKSGVPDKLSLRPKGSDTSEESARMGRTAAFLTAATAAAPFLSFEINKSAKPILSSPPTAAHPSASGIPIVGTTASEASGGHAQQQNSGSAAQRRRGSAGASMSVSARGGQGEKRMSLTLAGADGTMAGWRV